MGSWPGAGWLIGAGVLIGGLLALSSILLIPDPPRPMGLPTAGELVELEGYLDPAEMELPDGAGVPDRVVIRGSPFRGGRPDQVWEAGEGGQPVGSGQQAEPWRLSAVLITGERRIAIINDRMLRPGDRLEDGARLEAVENDHVVLVTPDGERKRLELER